MQEAGDGVSAGSCYGFYTNEKARAEVGITYHSGLFPIKDYSATGYFIGDDGVQGPNITVNHDLIDPNTSATLVFENSQSGFVSEFKMQMLGGKLVTDEPEPTPEPEFRISMTNPHTENAFGVVVDYVNTNQQIQLSTDLKNNGDSPQTFVYLIQIEDSEEIPVSVGWISGQISSGQTLSPSLSWTPQTSDSFIGTIYVFDGLNTLELLSVPLTLSLPTDGGTIHEITSSFQSPTFSQSDSLTISLNDDSVSEGDTIVVSGKVPNIQNILGATISIISPNGELVYVSASDISNSNYNFNIATGGLMKVTGDYEIRVQFGSLKTTDTFYYSGDDSSPEPEPEPEPTCGAGTELVNGICVIIETNDSDEISVRTNKSAYDPGNTITIHVTGASQTVTIEIRTDEGSMIERLSFPASSLGEINQPWTIPEETVPGKYIVKVSDDFNSAQTQFLIETSEPQIPEILSFVDKSTYLGGTKADWSVDSAIDGNGNVFVLGYTTSSDFPTTANAYESNFKGGKDIFISKFNSDLTILLSSTYLGGSRNETPQGIAVDDSGNIFVSGITESSDFPTISAYDDKLSGNKDAFVALFDNDLQSLLVSTYLGGSGNEVFAYPFVDNSGSLFITGSTDSNDFPITLNAFDQTFKSTEGFLTKFDNDLLTLTCSTFVGGSGNDYIYDKGTIDNFGYVYVVGTTQSSDFSTTTDAYSNHCKDNFFISKISNDLSSLTASTCIGSSNLETDPSIILDNSDDVIITGLSYGNFPTTSGVFMNNNPGGSASIVISKFNNELSSLKSSTFIGGNSLDNSPEVHVDSLNNIIISGFTTSSDYPTTTDAFDQTYNGNGGDDDGIFSILDTSLSTLLYSTYVGGSSGDFIHSSNLNDNDLYLTGTTYSLNFPQMTEGYQSQFNGDRDAFVLKFDLDSLPEPELTPEPDFKVDFETSGMSVLKIEQDNDFLSLLFEVDVTSSRGILEVTFNRDYFDSTFNGVDDDFIVLADGDEPSFSETQTNSQSRTLKIELSEGTEEIEIIGSKLNGNISNDFPHQETPEPYPEPEHEDHMDLEISAEKQVYDLNSVVVLNISLEGNTNSQNVALDITDPRGTTIVSRSLSLGPDDSISFEFKIDENAKTGNYKVTATTSDGNRTEKDSTHFKVKSQFNAFKISNVDVTDQQGNPSDLEAGEIGFIKVNLESNKLISTLVTVNIFDLELTSIGIGSVKTTLSSGDSEIILSFMIPDDAVLGHAEIYVNAFSDWPSNGGIPLTSEFTITESIGNGSPNPTPTPNPVLTVQTAQPHYVSGDNIIISGLIKNVAEYSQSVTVIVVSPEGNTVTIAQVIPSSDGSYSTSVKAGGTMIVSGDYEVRAQYGSAKVTDTFTFSGGNNNPTPEPEPTPEPIADKAAADKAAADKAAADKAAADKAAADKAVSNSIVVTTDKVSYSEGETIVITGEVMNLYSGTPVSTIVKAPNGNLVSITNLEVGIDKKFSTEVTAGGALMKNSGTYKVTVQYGTENRSATTYFEFGGSTVTSPTPVDSRVTDTTVSVSGTSELIEYTITGGQLLSVIPDKDGTSLIVSVDSSSSGILTLTIPRVILDATINGGDDDFFVLVDGEEVDFTEMTSSSDRKLFIGLQAGVEEIKIVGTFVI
jgi:hypothetical protein